MPPYDPRNIIAGYRGTLHWEDGSLYAEVTEWRVEANLTNSDEQPGGSLDVFAVLQGVSWSLNFTELVVQDLVPYTVLQALQNGQSPYLNFLGEVQRPDGTVRHYPIRYAVPDGTFPIIGSQPGQSITRAFSWRLNERPVLEQS